MLSTNRNFEEKLTEILIEIVEFALKTITLNLIVMFFIWSQGKEKLKKFTEDFKSFSDDIKFTYEFDKESIFFLDLKSCLF